MRFRLGRSYAWLPVLAGLWLHPGALAAQDQGPGSQRQGFWWGVGAGYGISRVDCNICIGDNTGGFSVSARAGLTVSPSVLLGLESNNWLHPDDVADRFQTSLNALAYWYPSLASGLNLKGGIGLTWYRASDGENAITMTSISPQIGAGYDIPVGRNMSVTPFLNMIAAPFGEMRFNGELAAPNANFTLLQLGIGVTWH
jgi:hypothetical protein